MLMRGEERGNRGSVRRREEGGERRSTRVMEGQFKRELQKRRLLRECVEDWTGGVEERHFSLEPLSGQTRTTQITVLEYFFLHQDQNARLYVCVCVYIQEQKIQSYKGALHCVLCSIYNPHISHGNGKTPAG